MSSTAHKQAMPFKLEELQNAQKAYQQFLEKRPLKSHARYIFPFFTGSYFGYRKVDVLRVVAVAKAINDNPSYLDVGCGYGDFLKRVREYIPDAKGVEKEGGIFYVLGVQKPDYIKITAVESIENEPMDVAFVGWMEPGADFRKQVARIAKCVVTTFDTGGQCGINGGCEYDEFGLQQIAWWRTPSWIDVNTELMNRYYTPSLSEEKKRQLADLRSAHNFWYVYARQEVADNIRKALASRVAEEVNAIERYDFESILDECGFRYMQELATVTTARHLWEVVFE